MFLGIKKIRKYNICFPNLNFYFLRNMLGIPIV